MPRQRCVARARNPHLDIVFFPMASTSKRERRGNLARTLAAATLQKDICGAPLPSFSPSHISKHMSRVEQALTSNLKEELFKSSGLTQPLAAHPAFRQLVVAIL